MAGFDIRRVWQARNAAELRDAYDASSDDYDHHVKEELGWIGPALIAREVATRVDADQPVLDVGAGTGLVGAELAACGFTTIDGNDIAPQMLALARAKGVYRDLLPATLGERLPYGDGVYAAATAAGVLLGNHAPPAALDELLRVVGPAGIVVFNLRAVADPSAGAAWSLDDYENRIAALREAGACRVLLKGDAVSMLPKGEPDALHRIWVLQRNETGTVA